MSIRAMKYLGESVLRKKAAPVKKVTDDLRRLVDDMFDTMAENHGQGLAAPQVGVSKRVIVVDVREDENTRHTFPLVNPRIISFFGRNVSMDEGCLSIPGLYIPVTRRDGVHVEYQDAKGRKSRIEARGLLARCIQHEVDHLNGVLFIDHSEIPEEKAKAIMTEYLAGRAGRRSEEVSPKASAG